MNDQANQPTAPNSETWTCTECGTAVAGPTVPKRSWLMGKKLPAPGDGATTLTRCVSCGKTLCQGCAKRLLKGSWPLGNMTSPCPQCGAKFGNGPVLVPAAAAAAYDRVGIGLEAAAYARTLKNWSQWIIFWSLLNLGSAVLIMLAGGDSDDASGAMASEGFLAFLLATNIITLGAGIICLASRVPWPGFYVIFSLYLAFVGISNVWDGSGFWRAVGVVQILLALMCVRDAGRYAAARPKTGG